jgi:hypothetical protein
MNRIVQWVEPEVYTDAQIEEAREAGRLLDEEWAIKMEFLNDPVLVAVEKTSELLITAETEADLAYEKAEVAQLAANSAAEFAALALEYAERATDAAIAVGEANERATEIYERQ